MPAFRLFLSAFCVCFLIDMSWLGFIAKNLYQSALGDLLKKNDGINLSPNWPAAILVYVCIAAGIVFFVMPKVNDDYTLALLWGAAFGAVTYGIYDFTNFSILQDWPLRITIIDFLWGTVLCALVTTATLYLKKTVMS